MSEDFNLDIGWDGATPEDLEKEFQGVLDRAEESQFAAMEGLGLKAEADTKRNIVSNGQVDTGNMLNSVEARTRHLMRGGIETKVVVPVDYALWQEVLHDPFLRPAVESNNQVAKQLLGATLVEPFDGVDL